MTIVLSEKDRKEIVKLYRRAQTTPVIGLSVSDMIHGRDFASLAWNNVRKKMTELGEKYGYDPRKHAINYETGEIEAYHSSAPTARNQDE
jgi:hypothetical protein